ncbi:MAG TPA: efflux RND transporter periplasmic adaptor subunit [Bryobacteraceae bacterium]|nr:efflux RND transporter periplasmic adaptor subunit [Bryobacteraceae bacterium]
MSTCNWEEALRLRILASMALSAALALSLTGCSHQTASAAPSNSPAPTVETVPDRNVVSIPNPERFGITPAVARREADQLLANGVVAADVSRSYAVNALFSGRVVEVKARLGDDVAKGQVLMTMTSPDMAQAFADYQKFQADAALAKTQLDRTQLLFSRGAVAQKDLDVAQDTSNKADVDLKAAAERIRLLGGNPDHVSPLIEIQAPVAGTIVEQNVTSAAGVKSLDSSPNLFTIADLSNIWVLCDVYENDLSRVHLGDAADIELNAYPNRMLRGKVTNISKLLDPNTRSAKVRIELPNPSGMLRPNMFATAHFVSQGTQTRTVIPSTAVLRLQDRDWVFVKLSPQTFRRTEVQAGAVDTDKTQQILDGLKPGDQVVNDALMFDREVQKSTEQ